MGICCPVKTLILNVRLDENRDYSAKKELLRWEKDLKENVESKTFQMTGASIYEMYNKEEAQYKYDELLTFKH